MYDSSTQKETVIFFFTVRSSCLSPSASDSLALGLWSPGDVSPFKACFERITFFIFHACFSSLPQFNLSSILDLVRRLGGWNGLSERVKTGYHVFSSLKGEAEVHPQSTDSF